MKKLVVLLMVVSLFFAALPAFAADLSACNELVAEMENGGLVGGYHFTNSNILVVKIHPSTYNAASTGTRLGMATCLLYKYGGKGLAFRSSVDRTDLGMMSLSPAWHDF